MGCNIKQWLVKCLVGLGCIWNWCDVNQWSHLDVQHGNGKSRNIKELIFLWGIFPLPGAIATGRSYLKFRPSGWFVTQDDSSWLYLHDILIMS
jgi:hypothetical protein